MRIEQSGFSVLDLVRVMAGVIAILLIAGCASVPEAAYKGNLDEVQRSLDRGEVTVTQRFHEGMTLLHFAAAGGHVQVARVLVERGAEVNERNDFDTTPLFLAVNRRHREMVEFLLANGAGPSLQVATKAGATPLISAVSAYEKGKPGGFTTGTGIFVAVETKEMVPADRFIAEMLLRAGADPNRPVSPAGNTPLHLAAYWAPPDVAALLLSSGADPSARNKDGMTPEDMAKANRNEFAARVIREARRD